MIKDTKHYVVTQGNGDLLHRIVLRSEECPIKGEAARINKNTILRSLVDNPDLLGLGFLEYETLKLEHYQGAWQLTATVIEPRQEK